MLKCRICGISNIDKNIHKENIDYIRHGNWYCHKSCYDERERRRQNISIHDNNSDDFWKDACYNYLKRDIKIEVTSLFFLQWEKYMKSKKPFYSAKGIYFALLYFYEIKKGNVDKSNGGIGIIPYIYDESRAYWYDRESRQKGIVADIERQIRMAEKRKQTVVRKTNEPKRFEVDFSVLDDLEEEDEGNFS